MPLTSVTFAFFFFLVFILYWFACNGDPRRQNVLLLLSGYFFYGWFNWKYAILLCAISLVTYSLAILMQGTAKGSTKKLFLLAGLLVDIGILAGFKYFNFFADACRRLFSIVGFTPDGVTIHVILPLGISFYVFLAVSYLVDVYQQKLAAVRNPVDVLLTLSFFPIISAGPIQRPIGLLPQIRNPRIFDYARASAGLKQILWGLFMKMLIADNCAAGVNAVFAKTAAPPGSMLLIGIFLFAIQIYADFAGYSNLAIGIAKLLGFDIIRNFAYPYFARDIREFWRRWNISLTTWFRDYVFLPLAYFMSRKIKAARSWGMRTETLIYIFGITVTWMLTGLWHGANYTFMVWGLLQGFFLVLHRAGATPRRKLLKKIHLRNDRSPFVIMETGLTFFLVMFSWIFFRADNIGQAWSHVTRIFSASLFQKPRLRAIPNLSVTVAFILIFVAVEWFGREEEYAIARLGGKWPRALRWTLYYAIILAIFWFSGQRQEFIYFQF